MQIDVEDLDILKSILQKYSCQFYVFGSRARGTATKYSDLDLCCFGAVTQDTLADIAAELEESDLPFKVDLVRYETCDTAFQGQIKDDFMKI